MRQDTSTRKVILLDNWHFKMDLGGGVHGDCWRIQAECYGHPNYASGELILPSCPVSLEGDMMTGKSGKIYQLGNIHPEADEKYQREQLSEAVIRGSWERK